MLSLVMLMLMLALALALLTLALYIALVRFALWFALRFGSLCALVRDYKYVVYINLSIFSEPNNIFYII
jgi:uncharacterized integral membrane protein